MFFVVLATLCLAVSTAHVLTPLQTFYPPNLNDTSYITNSSLGTYGGVYQAPTRDPSTIAPYGSYDYCTMPHPRVQEYSLPEPVKNGSVKANLVYLEYLQRHQRRTPYNILPGGEVCVFLSSLQVTCVANHHLEPTLQL
jgi:2-phosphoxylose phosphatase